MERLHMNDIREMIHRLRKGEKVREIRRALGFSRNTVRKYRVWASKQGLLDVSKPLPRIEDLGPLLDSVRRPEHMRSTVEPFGEVVKGFVEANVEMTAIWQRLRDEHGYTGSYSSVRRYVGRTHAKSPEAFCRVETKPGEEAQVDFGSAGVQWDGSRGKRRQAWVFVMTLSWSRHQYVEFVFDQKIETFLGCHERAFAWFGGVPQRVVLDNLKAGVLVASLHDPVLNEPYRRFAQHYDFLISPHRPRTPRHKGKVESGIRYVKRNFLAGQTFADAEALNERGRHWAMDVAGLREHGTTGEAPLGRFNRAERQALLPLPRNPHDLTAAYQPKVHRDCHVMVDWRYYSVPWRLIGQRVEVYVGRRIVEIYHDSELVATHPVAQQRGERQTRLEHYPRGKRAFLENPPERCKERAKVIGPCCAEVVERLFSDRPHDRLRSVQGLLRLTQRFGPKRLEAACRRALHYGVPSYRQIKTILETGLDYEPFEPAKTTAVTRQDYRYARHARTFFDREARQC